ncbi:Transcription factor bHLH30 [Dichanthelium oligosanthes]|uniref:Transcription factor bHLH30 n=1 Tax=Dichanthelium oligosanthes TaxID=888268 RepID=A0A1E5VGR1_9POAL|nr:Transcription factor bHLH30 [Dichanthelium oligosanthes]
MWEGGGVHGSHEALLLQAAGSGAGADYGHAGPVLLPWLGPAAAPGFSYMAPHHQGPPFVGAEAAAAGPFVGFGGGYGEGGVGQLGVFGLEPPLAPPPPNGLLAAAAAPPQGSRVVSGLLGTLQAELGRMTAKEIMDAKALAASRSHSEAERRRRQRINSHLARLRSLLPNTTKTDKASLLAEVIEHVKELKRQTSAVLGAEEEGEGEEASAAARRHLLLPTESDELAVDAGEDGEGRLIVRASLCCEDRAGLIPDIARALAALRVRARRAEIATLGGRVRNVLLITTTADDDEEEEEQGQGGDDGGDDADADGCGPASHYHRRHELVASIQEALRGVMDRKTASSDNTSSSSGGSGSIKRQRMSGAHEQGSL